MMASCFFSHKWSKWETKEVELYPSKETVVVQGRKCVRCNKVQFERLEV